MKTASGRKLSRKVKRSSGSVTLTFLRDEEGLRDEVNNEDGYLSATRLYISKLHTQASDEKLTILTLLIYQLGLEV